MTETHTTVQMKGDMSLEMIVKFLVLLVAAAVVIAMFLNVFPSGSPDVGNTQEIQDEQKIKTACQQVCDRWKRGSGLTAASAAVDYCTRRFSFDADGDNTVARQYGGSGYNTYCQDGVHCFNLHECTKSYQTLDAETCADIMCDYYSNPEVVPSGVDENARVEEAFAPVSEDNRGVGTCGLQDAQGPGGDINTWWEQNNLNPGTTGPC